MRMSATRLPGTSCREPRRVGRCRPARWRSPRPTPTGCGDRGSRPPPRRAARSPHPVLEMLGFVQAGGQGVPRDGGHDGVDPAVLGGGDPLDAPAVGAAEHPHPRIARLVELDTRPRGHPVDQPRDVPGLVVGAVDLHGAGRVAEASRVPGEHVVAGPVQITDRHTAEQVTGARQIGVTGLAPPRAHQDGRGRVAGRGAGHREPVGTDLCPVERRDGPVGGHARHRRGHDRGWPVVDGRAAVSMRQWRLRWSMPMRTTRPSIRSATRTGQCADQQE